MNEVRWIGKVVPVNSSRITLIELCTPFVRLSHRELRIADRWRKVLDVGSSPGRFGYPS